MKRLYSFCLAFVQLACPAIAAHISYVVLNRSGNNSLVRVSADGRSISPIAERASGYGLAKDNAGNYVVAAVGSLLRVTPYGNVSTIAEAPSGSRWMGVLQDFDGTFIVADNRQHAVWRVSPDGQTITKVATYSGDPPTLEGVGVILNESGEYSLVEDNQGTRLWRITRRGGLIPVRLGGLKIITGEHIIADRDGNYLVASQLDHAIFRVDRAGEVTKFAELNRDDSNITSLARNPVTGEVVVTVNLAQSLIRISADGQTVTRLTTDARYLSNPTAVLVEPEE
jgi:DNA-binding beta-propeller fold protein YncE